MALGRITGGMLSAELARVTTDIKFSSSGSANLLHLDATNDRVGIDKDPTVPLDVTGAIASTTTITGGTSVIGDTCTVAGGSITDSSGAISFGNENLTTTGQVNTSGVRLLENEITTIRSNDDLVLSANGTGGVSIEGSLTVSSDLTVNGSTTTVNSTTLTVDDKNIELAHSPSGASASDTLADGGGIILKGSTDHTILWTNATDDWDFTDSIDIASGKVFKVAGTTVLSGSNVTVATGTFSGATTHGSITIGGDGATVTGIKDEDNMSSNSAVKLATQQSIKAYVDAQVASADTFLELSDTAGSYTASALLSVNAAGNAVAMSELIYTVSSNDITLANATSNKDIIFNVNDGGSATEVMRLDGDVSALKIASGKQLQLGAAEEHLSGDGTDVTLTIGAGGDFNIGSGIGVTFGNDGEKIEGDGTDLTITGNTINLTATTDVALAVNTGLLMAGTEKLESDGTDLSITVGAGGDINIGADIGLTFGDDGEKIEGNGTDLTIASSNDLHLTATEDINVPADVGLTFGNDAEKIEGDGTDLTITGNTINLTATTDVALAVNTGLLLAGTEKIESDGTDLSITVGAGGDINIAANIGLTFGDDGEKIEGDGTDLTITGNNIKLTSANDVVIPANIGLVLDGSGSEKIESNGTDITFTSGADFIFASNSGASNILVPSGTTAQRAGTDAGQFRYNSTSGTFEGYSASGWGGLGGGDLTLVDDSSTTVSITLAQDSVLVSGGSNITSSISGNGVSIALDGDVTGLTNFTVDNININGNTMTASSGDITLAPAGSGDVNIGANLGLTFGDDGEKIEGDGTSLTISSSALLNLTATTDVVIPADVGLLFGSGGEKIESNGTNLTATITGNMEISGTTGLVVPAGTTGQRPSVTNGLIRYNSSLGAFEGCVDGSTFVSFATAPSGTAADINKDVFTTGNASTTTFTMSYSPTEANNIIVYVDNIMQEPTQNFTISGTTLTLTSAPHSGARVVVMHGFDSLGGVSGATWTAGSNTDIDSAIENVDTWTTATFQSAEYTYMAKNAEGTGDSTTGYETGKILIVHDSSAAQMTQYGVTHTSTAPLLTFTCDIDSGSIRLRAASIAANTSIKFARLGLSPF